IEIAAGKGIPLAKDLLQFGVRDIASAVGDMTPDHRDDVARASSCIYSGEAVGRIVCNGKEVVNELDFSLHRQANPHVLTTRNGQAWIETARLPKERRSRDDARLCNASSC